MSDSPSLAWYEPPDEPEPPSVWDWLKRNNAPKCRDCGGDTVATGEVDDNAAEFLCAALDEQTGDYKSCRPTWVSILPLSRQEREEE